MIKSGCFICLIVVWSLGSCLVAEVQKEGPAVVRRVNEHVRPGVVHMELEMTLEMPRASTLKRRLAVYRSVDGPVARSVFFFLEPEELEGMALLVHEASAPGAGARFWVHLPSSRETAEVDAASPTRVAGDFHYQDFKVFLSPDVETTVVGEDECGGHPCVTVERASGAPSITRIVVRKDLWLPIRWDFLGSDGRVERTLRAEEVRREGAYGFPHRLRMKNLESGRTTTVELESLDFDPEIPDLVWTPEALANGPPGHIEGARK